jgi:hypothetical protein
MSNKPKHVPTKNLGDLLNDPSMELPVEVPSNMFAPEKMNLKNLYMMQAFGVMFTKVLNDHGNASIMMRKQQLAISEITNIIELCGIIGECFDTVASKPISGA